MKNKLWALILYPVSFFMSADCLDINMPVGVTQIEPKVNKYMSCCWDFDLDEMKELIGGMIFFHNSKTSLSKSKQRLSPQ